MTNIFVMSTNIFVNGIALEDVSKWIDPAEPNSFLLFAVKRRAYRRCVIEPPFQDIRYALGTRIVRGREFNEHDTKRNPVVVINQQLAYRLFPGEDPIGKRTNLVNPQQSPEWRTIVGVVQSALFRRSATWASTMPETHRSIHHSRKHHSFGRN